MLASAAVIPLREHERIAQGVLEKFADGFTRKFSRGVLQFVHLQKPPAADGLCRLDGADLHIEVAHVYGTDSDARYILRREGYAAATDQERLESSLVPLDKRFIPPLNQVLSDKAGKSYVGSPIWLLVRIVTIVLTVDDIREWQSQILIPPTHPFTEIWLMCGIEVNFGMTQLYAE